MEVHPGPEKRRFPTAKLANSDPIWRALQENEDWYQDLVEHSLDLLCVHDLQGRLLSVNPAPARLLGYSVEEILRIPMREMIAPEFRDGFESYLHEIEQKGEVHGLLTVLTRSGERRIWEFRNTLRTEGVDSPIVRGMAHDVTEQRRAAKLLREAGELNRHIIASASEGVVVFDRNLRCVAWNPFMKKLLGIPASTALGKPYSELVPPEIKNHDPGEDLRRALQGQTITVPDERITGADGRQWWISSCKSPLRDGDGKVAGVIVTVQDITERRRAEERLREYERVVEDLEEMIIVYDRQYRFVIANQAFLRYRGLRKEQVIGHTIPEIVHEAVLPTIMNKVNEAFRGKVVRFDLKYKYPDLGERDLFVSYFPIEGATGVDRVACVLRDVTERKRADERLQEYERVIEDLDEMIVVVDRDYRYVIANPAYLRQRDMKKEQVIGHTIAEVVDPAVLEIILEKVDESFEGKVVEYDLKYPYPKLGERDVFVSYFPIEGPTGVDRIACIFRDITERKRAGEALRLSEESYRHFISQSSEGIFREELDAPVSVHLPEDQLIHHILHDHYMAECNDAMAAMYGLKSGKELEGTRLTEMVVPDDPSNIELTREFVRSGFRVIDRESHEVDVHGNPKVFLNSMIGTVENGMLVRTWGIQRDITAKVKAEESRRKAEEELRQTVAQLQEVSEELRVAKEKLAEEKLYLEETIDTELGFGEIIGRSKPLQEVMAKVARVAPSDATVLLLGETGTGKELVARAIHRMSRREKNSFIKMNCAAIPSGLLESELFGHEKGAFTGAVGRKIGRLELADRGTLFLDEIGDIPLALQPKLLRVLQDMEFERLGGTQTLKVDFRLLAATNRDLLQGVKAREFRSDLYYRLNVFPILLPPLRERREDIPPLVKHFVQKFAAQMKKSITSIPSKTMEALVRWEWPGNIRELENFMERSVILTVGSLLQSPLSELEKAVEESNEGKSVTLRDKERERILKALRECRGKLGGADGAAARLGLKRTTLQSKLDQLGIKPGMYRD